VDGLCSRADCVCRLLKEFGPFDESMVRAYVQDVVCGVAHLHELGIAHRDLKCANLLLADDERGGVKIADFGTAKRAVEEESLAEGVIAEEEDEDKPMETARCVGLAGYDDGRASTSY
jgi:serine/threonine protein kinase